MKNNCVFTICAKNYIGLANVLMESITKYYDDLDYYIIVADELNNEFELPKNTVLFDSFGYFNDTQQKLLAFKYSLTEYCTLLKPFSFKWFFDKGYKKVCYFDPDILFFDSIQPLFDQLDKYSIVLTPHFLTFPENEISQKFESEVKFSGLYNLGFLGLSKSDKVNSMLNWWSNNLLDKCFTDIQTFQFTDQKWMDFMPIFFDQDELFLSREMGWNLAPWNIFERQIELFDNHYFVFDRNSKKSEKHALLFVHFSGFDYKKLLVNNEIIQNNEGHENDFEDFNLLLDYYRQNLLNKKDDILHYLGATYSYLNFKNGKRISKFHRRLFRSYLDLYPNYDENPFDESSSFYKMLNKSKLILDNIDNSVENVRNNKSLVSNKLKKANWLFKLLFKIVGEKKYLTILRFLHKYSIYENQLFLLDKKLIHW